MAEKKRIAVLGSTGSVGRQTLDVIAAYPDKFELIAISAHTNIECLSEQITKFKPKMVAVFDEEKAKQLKVLFPHLDLIPSIEGLSACASHPEVDVVVCAMTGTKALIPTLNAIENGKHIAIANKEILVSAGELITRKAKKHSARLLPIDSEHSAIFQCLLGQSKKDVSRIVLTASGGPFFSWEYKDLKRITVDDALKHPTWNMGVKNTIDSSTLMNKGLELIEAKWLFDVTPKQLQAVIHPQSIVHSFVEFFDGAMIAQMALPDMHIPIQYALSYPDRFETHCKKIDFSSFLKLEFYPIDLEKFRCMKLAQWTLEQNCLYSCFLNAANEVLVSRFASGAVSWEEIGIKLEQLIEKQDFKEEINLDNIISVDKQARILALNI